MLYIYDLIQANIWIIYIAIILGIAILLQIRSKRIVDYLTVKTEKLNNIFASALLKVIHIPLTVLMWLLAISCSFSILLAHEKYHFLISSHLQIRKIAIIMISCWICMRFIRQMEILFLQEAAKHNKIVDKTLINALSQLSTITVFIVGLLAIMQIMNIPITGLLAFGGIGGASVAFASKELLTNFFGGLIIYMDQPFKVGDWIRSPEKNMEGVVEYIGWRMTRIRTFDKYPLYVPNCVFLTISVENPSRMQYRRLKITIGIRYQDADKINIISKEIREMLQKHSDIDTSQSLMVNLVEFASAGLNIMVSAYSKRTQSDQFQMAKHEILMNILHIITQNGAQCAYPSPLVSP